jgi:hypothetical protein
VKQRSCLSYERCTPCALFFSLFFYHTAYQAQSLEVYGKGKWTKLQVSGFRTKTETLRKPESTGAITERKELRKLT